MDVAIDTDSFIAANALAERLAPHDPETVVRGEGCSVVVRLAMLDRLTLLLPSVREWAKAFYVPEVVIRVGSRSYTLHTGEQQLGAVRRNSP